MEFLSGVLPLLGSKWVYRSRCSIRIYTKGVAVYSTLLFSQTWHDRMHPLANLYGDMTAQGDSNLRGLHSSRLRLQLETNAAKRSRTAHPRSPNTCRTWLARSYFKHPQNPPHHNRSPTTNTFSIAVDLPCHRA